MVVYDLELIMDPFFLYHMQLRSKKSLNNEKYL